MNGRSARKLLVVQVAALDYELQTPPLNFAPVPTVLPAVTCTVQASFRTAAAPGAWACCSGSRASARTPT